jgi:deoxycytidylate deaminase
MCKKLNLVLGLSGPYGAGCTSLAEDIKQIVDNWPGCHSEIIHVASLIERYYPIIYDKNLETDSGNLAGRREILQDAGTKLRQYDNPELIGKIISSEIYQKGLEIEEERHNYNIKIIIYIIDSLKNSYDLELLRRTYSYEFYFIFIHADREARWRRMIDYKSWKTQDRVKFEERDQVDQNEKNINSGVKDRGQEVGKLSSMADYYIVNSDNREKLRNDGERFIEILFGSNKNQPTVHERFMHIAFSASNASFCLSRQVGAAILDSEENILGIGYNDVPKSDGGLYSYENGKEDRRCYLVGDRRCINDTNKQERFEELSDRIIKELKLCESQSESLKNIIRKSSFREVIEYCRATHAEMEALLSVARTSRGSTVGATMYVTTEPCHNCTKHIICAGIKKVYFMEPYPKSLGLELHSDSIAIGAENEGQAENKVLFIPYEGIAPHRFHDFFALVGDRKDKNGKYLSRLKAVQADSPKFAARINKRTRSDDKNFDPITSLEYSNVSDIAKIIERKEENSDGKMETF